MLYLYKAIDIKDLLTNIDFTKYDNDDKYYEYIEKIYNGFTIFGLPMTSSTLSSFCVIILGVISWLLDYII